MWEIRFNCAGWNWPVAKVPSEIKVRRKWDVELVSGEEMARRIVDALNRVEEEH